MSKKNIGDETEEEVWAEIYFLRCKAYINLNKIDSGLKDINTFFDLIEVEKNKIKNEILKKDKKKTIDNFDIEKIIYQKYDISEAHFKKGYCYLVLLDYNSALKEFEKAIKLDPTYTTAYFNMGICLYNLNNKKDAIYYYQKVLNSCPTDVEAFINLVKCYREIGRPKISYDLLIKQIPLYLKEENNYLTKIPKLYYETGMSLSFMERYEDASIYFKKSIDFEIEKNKKNDPEFLSECYYRQGYCLSKLNNKKDALKEFEEALKYNNKNADIHNYKAHCLMILGNYEQAIESYIQSINLNEKKFSRINDGNFSIGYCYVKMNKYEDAIKYFDISRKINENEIKNIYLNGIQSCNEGKAEESLIKFNYVYRDLSSKFLDLNFYNGICNMELGKYPEAIKNFDNCNKYDKKFSESYFKKGIIYSMQNKSKEAIDQFEKAIYCNNKIQEYKEALQKEKEKIHKDNNNNEDKDIKHNKTEEKNIIEENNKKNTIEDNNKKNTIEESNKKENDFYLKKTSSGLKYDIIEEDNDNDNDNDSIECLQNMDKKEELNNDLDIKKSKTIKILNKNGMIKNKLISKTRNINNDIKEERKEHFSNDENENAEMKLSLDNDSEKFNENIKKTNNTFGPIRYESKTFVIKEK